MAHKIHVQPLGWLARIADVAMVPIMYIVSGTFKEIPQRTHRWNHPRVLKEEISNLSSDMMVFCKGDVNALNPTQWLSRLRFHIPILGGWRTYVVLCSPDTKQGWYVGWTSPIGAGAGVSRIKIHGSVRMLIGLGPVIFFGVDVAENQQITIEEIGRGYIGDNGPYSQVPLL